MALSDPPSAGPAPLSPDEVSRRSSSGSSMASASGERGSLTWKSAPCPGAVRTETVPPCAETSPATIASPSPVPPEARLRAASAR